MTNNFYLKHKEKLRKEACKSYQNLSEEEKEKKCQYHREHNKNLSEKQKQKLVKYIRNYYSAHEKSILSCFADCLNILGKLKIYIKFPYQVFQKLSIFSCYVL